MRDIFFSFHKNGEDFDIVWHLVHFILWRSTSYGKKIKILSEFSSVFFKRIFSQKVYRKLKFPSLWDVHFTQFLKVSNSRGQNTSKEQFFYFMKTVHSQREPIYEPIWFQSFKIAVSSKSLMWFTIYDVMKKFNFDFFFKLVFKENDSLPSRD